MINQQIDNFETLQLNDFNNYDKLIELRKLCNHLGLELRTGIAKLEDFNPKQCARQKLIHSGYLYFEVLYKKKRIDLNIADFGCLEWSQSISELKSNKKYKLYSWVEDEDMQEEIERVLNYLKNFKDKEEMCLFFDKYKSNN